MTEGNSEKRKRDQEPQDDSVEPPRQTRRVDLTAEEALRSIEGSPRTDVFQETEHPEELYQPNDDFDLSDITVGEVVYYGESGGKSISQVMRLSTKDKKEMRLRQLVHAGFSDQARPGTGRFFRNINQVTDADSTVNVKSIRLHLALRDRVFDIGQRQEWPYLGINKPQHVFCLAPDLDFMSQPQWFDKIHSSNPGFYKILSWMVARLTDEMRVLMVQKHSMFITTEADQGVSTTIAILRNYMRGRLFLSGFITQTSEDVARNCKRIPPFMTRYRITPAWEVPRTVLSHGLIDTQVSHDIVKAARDAFTDVTDSYVLSNGCLVGQIKRLDNTTRVGLEVRDRTPEASRKYSHDDLVKSIAMIGFDLPERSSIMEWYDRLGFGNDSGNPLLEGYYTIQKDASAGMIWPEGTKREAVFLSDVDFSMRILTGLKTLDEQALLDRGVIDDPGVEQRNLQRESTFSTLLEAFHQNKLVQIKPKYQIMKVDELKTKVRNIFVYPSCFQVHVGVLSHVAMKLEHKIFSEETEFSLAKFAPLYRGLHDIVTTLLLRSQSDPNQMSGAFYSDNCYFVLPDVKDGHPVWISCDVEKMDSTSTITEGRFVMEVLLTAVGMPECFLRRYLKFMGGDFSNDCVGVLRSFLFNVPGLASGSQTTFWTNHIRMSVAFSRIIAALENPALKATFLATQNGKRIPLNYVDLGVYFNLERTVSSDEPFRERPRQFDSTQDFIGLIQAFDPSSKLGTLTEFGPILKLDMLGFDATPFILSATDFEDYALDPKLDTIGAPVLAACLDYERLMKAICFRKTKEKKSNNQEAAHITDFVVKVVHLMTLQVLYLVGGFAYRTASALLKGCAISLLASLKGSAEAIVAERTSSSATFSTTVDYLAAIIETQAKEFLTSGDAECILTEEQVETLFTTVNTLVQTLLTSQNPTETVSKSFTRSFILTRYHTLTGRKEAQLLKAAKSGRQSETQLARSAKNVPSKLTKEQQNMYGF